MKFQELSLHPQILDCITSIGFEDTTPIQEQTIPLILEGRDLIASAQTGTGKTAAFLIPLLHKIITGEQEDHVKALVIVPTRELAVQIDQHLQGLSYFTNISSIAVYGGTDGISYAQEQQALTEGADIIICTPGRIISHLAGNYSKISRLQFLVLDEADRMLDMGFYDDIMKIISYLPKERQTLLFSATMPAMIKVLARKILRNPAEIMLGVSMPAEKILQSAYVVYENQKFELIKILLLNKKLRSILIFCSTKSKTKEVTKILKSAGFNADDIHSDHEQSKREETLLRFKSRALNILVATDILSRGIDIEDIDLVINYDVPNDGEDYIHRIGRTARAEADGLAITFIGESEQAKFGAIEKLLGHSVYKVKLPPSMEAGPEYNPSVRIHKKGNFRKGGVKKGYGKR